MRSRRATGARIEELARKASPARSATGEARRRVARWKRSAPIARRWAIRISAISSPLDPGRFERFSLTLGDLTLDYSKNRIVAETMQLLLALAEAAEVAALRDAMFAGEPINITENRAVLHVALRAPKDADIRVDGENVVPEVHETLDRFLAFADQIRSGEIRGVAGDTFTDVVNIGIGGSDLGPAMAIAALTPYRGGGPRVHFVSNVDGAHLADTLAGLDAERTLFLDRLEDLHHLGDDDQRRLGARLARLPARRGGGRRPFRRDLHQPREGRRVRHQARPRLRFLGLGGRPLFGVVGDRPAARDLDRRGELPQLPRRRARDGRAFPHRAARARTCRSSWGCSASGIATCSTSARMRCCPTTSGSRASPRTCSSSTWNRTASG